MSAATNSLDPPYRMDKLRKRKPRIKARSSSKSSNEPGCCDNCMSWTQSTWRAVPSRDWWEDLFLLRLPGLVGVVGTIIACAFFLLRMVTQVVPVSHTGVMLYAVVVLGFIIVSVPTVFKVLWR